MKMSTKQAEKLDIKVKQNFRCCNNLMTDMQKSLNKIKELVRSKQIVICKADKDGKILIIDYDEYDTIMLQLEASTTLKNNNLNNLFQTFDKLTNYCNNQIIELHKLNYINNKLLFHTTGLKYNNNTYHKTSSLTAKHFSSYVPVYAYPLLKTHKSTNEELCIRAVTKFLISLLQSAGDITTSCITAFLELPLNSISENFCPNSTNENCQDSKNYLLNLESWKSSLETNYTENWIFQKNLILFGLFCWLTYRYYTQV